MADILNVLSVVSSVQLVTVLLPCRRCKLRLSVSSHVV